MKLKKLIIKPRTGPFVSTRKCCSMNKVITALGCMMLFLPTKNRVKMPDTDELVFDKLKDIGSEQKFMRNKLSTMNFDSSSLK